MMNIRYSNQKRFRHGVSIFLAGPTPRSLDVLSWRPQAIEILRRLGFEGTVLVPEREDWSVKFEYTDQVGWEYSGLANATIIVFWVPREMSKMPALTTNAEFGLWLAKNPERIVYGRPDTAVSMERLDELYADNSRRRINTTLEETLATAVKLSKRAPKAPAIRRHSHEGSTYVFWIPRDSKNGMPCLDDNVDFGFQMGRDPKSVVYGRPDTADSVRYLDWLYKKFNRRKIHTTVEDTVRAAVRQAMRQPSSGER